MRLAHLLTTSDGCAAASARWCRSCATSCTTRAETSAGDGPAAAVAQYAERMTERTGLRFDLELDARLRLPAQQEREVCRIAQEAMTNVERHARATSVKVSWVKRDGCAELRVLDDGRGFTPGQSGRRNTYGLLGMRERFSHRSNAFSRARIGPGNPGAVLVAGPIPRDGLGGTNTKR